MMRIHGWIQMLSALLFVASRNDLVQQTRQLLVFDLVSDNSCRNLLFDESQVFLEGVNQVCGTVARMDPLLKRLWRRLKSRYK